MSHGRARHPLAAGEPPAWACAWGQDAQGIFAAFRLGGREHELRWIPPGASQVEPEAGMSPRRFEAFWIGVVALKAALALVNEGVPALGARLPSEVEWRHACGVCPSLAAAPKGLRLLVPSPGEP